MADDKKTAPLTTGLRSTTRKRGDDLSNYVFGRVQPQATPLEEAVLGAVMLDKDALTVILDILRAESFYLDAHQLIYRAMLRLFERSQPIDLLTVMEELKKSGDLEAVGGPAYLAELTNRVASAANIEYHSRIIAQKHIQRELITVSTQTIRDAFEDTTDVFQLLDDAEQGLFAIAQQNMSKGFDSMGSLASKALKQLEELKNKEDGLTGVPTGFTELDRLTSGFQPSDLVIIAARPGMGKCLGKGTRVLMYDGTLKKVEDIRPGDLVMGDDSTARKVRSLGRGRERMYWIRQDQAMDYRVNESHILSLKNCSKHDPAQKDAVLDISVKKYLSESTQLQSNYKGFKVAVDFPKQQLPLAPYFLGLWLGNARVAKLKFASSHPSAAASYQKGEMLSTISSNLAPILELNIPANLNSFSLETELEALGVLKNKHIPEIYLTNSRKNRLQLLAGLIDSAPDWTCLEPSKTYRLTQKCKALAKQIKFLCDTLGYRTALTSESKSNETEHTLYQLNICGDLAEIPLRIQDKITHPQNYSIIDWQTTEIQVEYDKVDDFYGFELDGNGRFLLEDMTVTHNTAFTLSFAKNAATIFQKPVAFFSLEMSSLQLAQRIIAMEAEISGMKMRNGQLEEYEWQQLNSAIERVSEAPIFIDDTPGINVFELRAKCRRLKMQHDIQLIIIDYLQLMSGGGDSQRGNREQEVSAISRALKGLAKELNVPVIALSQLSRAVEMRGGTKRPQLSDLRESGSIEQDADIVSFIYRPEYYQILEDEEGQSLKDVAEIIVAKHRHGALKTVKLRFTPEFARFSDLDDPDFSNLPEDTFDAANYNNIITRPSKMNDDEDIPF
ncbi:MAG: replicative DNA helicase [Saprospiraceae bacterium]|nr:MAG: replicative DNA helicase [Saprospiraceae bacterium]